MTFAVPTINVFMLVDSELLRMALRQIIQAESNLRLVGEAADTDALLDHFADGSADVVMAKRTAVRGDLRQWIASVKAQSSVKILLLLNAPGEFFEVVSAGADGFMLTDSPAYLFAVAIRVVHEGDCWIGPIICRHLIQAEQRFANGLNSPGSSVAVAAESGEELLTTKEREVMRHLNDGLSNAQIAERLQLSVETVRVHVRNILRKLGVRDRNEAIARANGQQFTRR